MKRRTLIGIIILMSISLIGIILVQLMWIRNAIDVKEKQFDRSVNEAMNQVVQRLEKNENILVISDQLSRAKHRFNYTFPDLDSIMQYQYVIFDSLGKQFGNINSNVQELEWLEKDYKTRLESYSWFDTAESHVQFKLSIPDDLDTDVDLDRETHVEVSNNGVFLYSEKSDSAEMLVRAESRVKLKKIELNNMLEQMVVEVESFSTPISQRLDQKYLGSQIKQGLSEFGIDIPFEFAVVSGLADNPVPVRSENFVDENLGTKYRASLFPNDIFQKPNFLLLTFPDVSSHLYRSIILMLAGSVVFTLIILITFSVTIWVILRQKKISEIKTDFINNMTHEFKTPIATISLAVDSIDNPKILSLPEKIRYFTGIIRDENRRMNKQVENVLQMSMIDKRDFKLNVKEVDVHEVISRTADHFKLQLEKKHGEIHLNLHAENPLIRNDEMHFSNIINNLIDNAIKYSKENPEITISTENTNKGIKISVEDNGIGISKDAQDKIFDKFFRVSTDDVHNVKGFGLGLSYVKALVLTFRGSIDVKSEPGKGTRFDIFLPFKAEGLHA
jgi:two-component system phosphate regulon sensor histidine kinase PhoR